MKIRNTVYCGLVALAVLPWAGAYAQTPAPVATPTSGVASSLSPSTAEVIKLTQSGVSEDVIVAYVKNSQSAFNLSANDLVTLRNAGIPNQVLTEMLDHDKAVRIPSDPLAYEQKLYGNGQVAPPAPAATPAPAPAPAPVAQPAPAPAPQTVVVQQAPPPVRLEVIPVSPGPEYVWTPGYWAWRGGVYVWVGGCYAHRPRPGVVWMGGHWARHGHGYVWMGGHWH